MRLEEVREMIDGLDLQLKDLLMKRFDCSLEVAKAKAAAGETAIYRPEREAEIIRRLLEGVPEDRAAAYAAVVKKIMEASRMYQYGRLFEWDPDLFPGLPEGVSPAQDTKRVVFRLTRPNCPNAMSSILCMIGDHGYNMERMELTGYPEDRKQVTFELTVLGNLKDKNLRKLMFQLSMESGAFRIVRAE